MSFLEEEKNKSKIRRLPHSLVGELIGPRIPLTENMRECHSSAKGSAQGLRFLLQRAQMGGIDFVAPFHLSCHELTVCVDQNAVGTPRLRFFQTAYQRFVLRDIVGRSPDPLAYFRQGFPGFIRYEYSDPRRAGIAFTGTVDKKNKFSHTRYYDTKLSLIKTLMR